MSSIDVDGLTAAEMGRVNECITGALQSDVLLINQVGTYIIGAGGKRLRPKLVLLAANALGYAGEKHLNVAAIIEFIHTATLLHDDVVDSSTLRRGRDTANAVWGNEAAVLVGDFLYSRAFEMMVGVESMRVMEILSSATNTIASGEVMQLLNVGETDVSVERYMAVIAAKTAKLFEAATQLGAVLAGAGAAKEQALAQYGMHLGAAFQLIDDALDYSAAADQLGKNAGDDLAEGKPTLPLILTMQNSDEKMRDRIGHVLRVAAGQAEDAGTQEEQLAEIVTLVQQSGAIEATTQVARQEVEKAIGRIESLPPGDYREALIAVAQQSVDRQF